MKKCVCCNNDIPSQMVIEGKTRNLQNRTKCLVCLPFGQSPYRKKTIEEKRSYDAEKARRWYYRKKEELGKDPIKIKREQNKTKILNLVNTQCQFCGYNSCFRNLSFHHLSDKDFKLSSREFQFSMKKLIPELKKCVVACHNCHGEIHEGLIDEKIVKDKNTEFVFQLTKIN